MNFREYTRSSYQKHFQPKMHQTAFGGHIRRTPWNACLQRSPDSWIKGSLFLREGDGKEVEGDRMGGSEGERDGVEGERRREEYIDWIDEGPLLLILDTPLLLYDHSDIMLLLQG